MRPAIDHWPWRARAQQCRGAEGMLPFAPYLHEDGRTWANPTVCIRSATECSGRIASVFGLDNDVYGGLVTRPRRQPRRQNRPTATPRAVSGGAFRDAGVRAAYEGAGAVTDRGAATGRAARTGPAMSAPPSAAT